MFCETDTEPSASSHVDVEALERELTTLAGHLNAGNFRFLTLLAEFDRRGGYAGMGIASCAHWLSWRCGIGLIAAREKVRVARALEQLPRVSDAMRRGVLSYCKVRAVTRIATAENESLLLSIAESGTVSHVEKVVRLYRRAERAQELELANQQFAERYLQCYVDDAGAVVNRGRLAPEQGVVFMKALQAAVDALREAERDSRESSCCPDTPRDSQAARNADAAALMAESFVAHGMGLLAGSERHLVTVHVDEAVLHDGVEEGRCEISDEVAAPPETARRLACDASLVTMMESEGGQPLELGRKTRAVSTPLRRALEARDGGCRYPGCTNRRFVDAHHIVHWADGGPTNLDNLVLLCRRHHRFMHEHGYSIVHAGGEFAFFAPDGRSIPRVPALAAVEAEAGWSELRAQHECAGLSIDSDTGDSHWGGETMEYDSVLQALFDRSGVPESPVSAASAPTGPSRTEIPH